MSRRACLAAVTCALAISSIAAAQPVEPGGDRWTEAAGKQGESQRDDLAILDRGRLAQVTPASAPLHAAVGMASLWALVLGVAAWALAQGIVRIRAARELRSGLAGAALVTVSALLLARGERWVPASAEAIMRLASGEVGLTAAGIQPQWPSSGAAFAWLWAALLNQPSLKLARALVPFESIVACACLALAAWRLFANRAAAISAAIVGALLLHQGAESLVMGAEPAATMLSAALLALAANPRPRTVELLLLTLLSPLAAASSQAGWAAVLVALTLQAALAANLARHALPLLVGLGATVLGLLGTSELASGSYLNEVAWLLSAQRALAVVVVVLFAIGVSFAVQARRTPALLVVLVVPLALGTAYFGNIGFRLDSARSVVDVVVVPVALLAGAALATLLDWAPEGWSRRALSGVLAACAVGLLAWPSLAPPTSRPYESQLFDLTAQVGRDAWRTHTKVFFVGPRETLAAQLLASLRDGWAHENPHIANLPPPPPIKYGQPTFPTGCVVVHVGLDDSNVPSSIADGARTALHLDYFSRVAHVTLDALELEAARCSEPERLAGAVRVL